MRCRTRVLPLVAVIAAAGLGPGVAARAAGGLNGLDCNGFGAGATVANPVDYLCSDLRAGDEPPEDNGHYVGHDEPLTAFYSNTPGSGNNVRYTIHLPADPPQLPTGSRHGPIDTFMLGPTLWFGMVLCDTESYPEGSSTCTPDADTNIQDPFSPDHAGTAFLEVQFYPPGWPPFIDQFSCDVAHWCVSLHINSVQASFNFENVNPNCEETTQFAFLTRSGVPIGPTGPDNLTAQSVTPNGDVFLMNQGDTIQLTIKDTPTGLFTGVTDMTSGGRGSMTAGAGNGWRHMIWDPVDHTCNATPYTYHPMYSTSQPVSPDGNAPTSAGWAAHTTNIAASWEIGHFQKPHKHHPQGAGPCYPGPTIPGCIGEDQRFTGYAYKRGIWPDGSPLHPTPFEWSSPLSSMDGSYAGQYAQVGFETNLSQLEDAFGFPCNRFTGEGCIVPPPGVEFYPWPHTQPFSASRGCGWSIGADLPDQISDFGGMTSAWGPPLVVNYGGGFVVADNFGRTLDNPCP